MYYFNTSNPFVIVTILFFLLFHIFPFFLFLYYLSGHLFNILEFLFLCLALISLYRWIYRCWNISVSVIVLLAHALTVFCLFFIWQSSHRKQQNESRNILLKGSVEDYCNLVFCKRANVPNFTIKRLQERSERSAASLRIFTFLEEVASLNLRQSAWRRFFIFFNFSTFKVESLNFNLCI